MSIITTSPLIFSLPIEIIDMTPQTINPTVSTRRQMLTVSLALPVCGLAFLETSCSLSANEILRDIEIVDGAIQAATVSLATVPALAPYVAAIDIYLQLVTAFCQTLSQDLATQTASALQKSSAIINDAARLVIPQIPNQQAQTIVGGVAGAVSALLAALSLPVPGSGGVGPSSAQAAVAMRKIHITADNRKQAAILARKFEGYKTLIPAVKR